MIYAAIDPGKKGAVAAIWPDGSARAWYTPVLITRTKMPKALTASGKPKYKTKESYQPLAMYSLLAKIRDAAKKKGYELVFAIEGQTGRETDAKKAVFTVGEGYGRWLQTLALVGIEPRIIWPQVWRNEFMPAGSDKSVSLSLARKLYPRVPLPLAKDEGRADALLMADWLRRDGEGLPKYRVRPPRTRRPLIEEVSDEDRPRSKRKRNRRLATILGGRR